MGAPEFFNWVEDETIVVPEQPATAVYTNAHGYVVVRQERPYPEADVFVILTADNAVRVGKALLAEALQMDPAGPHYAAEAAT